MILILPINLNNFRNNIKFTKRNQLIGEIKKKDILRYQNLSIKIEYDGGTQKVPSIFFYFLFNCKI